MLCWLNEYATGTAYGFNFSNSFNSYKFLSSQFFPDILFKPFKPFKHH